MRIVVAAPYRRKLGGIESYLETCIEGLASHGHEIALFCEGEGPAERDPIRLPSGARFFSALELGMAGVLSDLQEWHPDLIYAHGLSDPVLEEQVVGLAPCVFFAHGYHGTCISGNKTLTFPTAVCCRRRFGAACLGHYFPRRCGGLNPVTMWRMYNLQARHFATLRRCQAVVTASKHMRTEYLHHGLDERRVFCIDLPVKCRDQDRDDQAGASLPDTGPVKILFVGRFEWLKGGWILLDAMPAVISELGRPVLLTFAGAGRDAASWQQRAQEIAARQSSLRVEFAGWLSENDRRSLMQQAHLLVIPSVWPEPFGLIGLEAGLCGLPAAAFATGGIPEWLTDGVNGYLAATNPPTAAALARAIVRCVRDPSHHQHLRRGALDTARRYTVESHLDKLTTAISRTTGL